MTDLRGQRHVIIGSAGHFLPEDRGEEVAQVIVDFSERTPRRREGAKR